MTKQNLCVTEEEEKKSLELRIKEVAADEDGDPLTAGLHHEPMQPLSTQLKAFPLLPHFKRGI